jgi:hypothetical protein
MKSVREKLIAFGSLALFGAGNGLFWEFNSQRFDGKLNVWLGISALVLVSLGLVLNVWHIYHQPNK